MAYVWVCSYETWYCPCGYSLTVIPSQWEKIDWVSEDGVPVPNGFYYHRTRCPAAGSTIKRSRIDSVIGSLTLDVLGPDEPVERDGEF